MNLAGLATYPRYVVKGSVIILAISLPKLGQKDG
jgi:ABC-type glucose/galactose transport system permease subunit